jgi:uncharacterized protein
MPIDRTDASVRAEICPGVFVDARLAVWIEAERILVMADLHWGYAETHRARGNLLPQWGDEAIEAQLNSLVTDYSPVEVIWLGDVVHGREGATAAERYLTRATVPITVLAGNHDRHWNGATAVAVQRGRYYFHHGDVPRTVPSGCTEMIGHYHPAYAWNDGAGGRVKLPALIASPQRLILPAFSPWAAGAELASEPSATVWLIAPRRIFPLRSPAPVSIAV